MPLVRLFKSGGHPGTHIVEDLDMSIVPVIGDTIVIGYQRHEEVYYSVVGRIFNVGLGEGRQYGDPTIALEVEDVTPRPRG